MNLNRQAGMTLMALSLLAGFGVSYSRHDQRPEVHKNASPTSRSVSEPRAHRDSTPEKIWLGDHAVNVEDMKARLLAACSSDTWTEELEKGAVLVLIADPSFINILFRNTKLDPLDHLAWPVTRIFDRMTDVCPSSVLPVIDAADFDLSSSTSDWKWYLKIRTRYDPLRTFETLRRNRSKFTYYPDALLGAYAVFPDCARAILIEEVGRSEGKALYRDSDLRTAVSVVLREDGALPPGAEHLPAVLTETQNIKSAKGIYDWTNEVRDHGRLLTPSQFQELVDKDRIEEAGNYLEALIETGQSKEAFDQFKNWTATEGTDFSKGTLAATIATAIHENGGHVGDAILQLGDQSDGRYDSSYTEAQGKLLTRWAEADPLAAREYLQHVTDPAFREKLGQTIEHALLTP